MCFRPPALDSEPVACPKCGATVPAGANSCPSCGAAADEKKPPVVPPVMPPKVPSVPKGPSVPRPPAANK